MTPNKMSVWRPGPWTTKDESGFIGLKSASEPSGIIDVTASSITVGDVFDVFALRLSTPIGIESWTIQEGRYQGSVHPEGHVVFENAVLTLDQLGLETSGVVDFSTAPAAVQLEGQATHIQLSQVLENLGARPAPVGGLADATFQLQFSAEARDGWRT